MLKHGTKHGILSKVLQMHAFFSQPAGPLPSRTDKHGKSGHEFSDVGTRHGAVELRSSGTPSLRVRSTSAKLI